MIEFSLVIATYNESKNIVALLEEIGKNLHGISHEIIVVDDDSPDLTWKLAQGYSASHDTVKVIRRQGRRGLSSAICEGFAAGRGSYLAVMDADFSHDSALLPRFVTELRQGFDIVVASRRVPGGGIVGWPVLRHLYSSAATCVAKLFLGGGVADPLSGYFALSRGTFERLSREMAPKGYKILLDILMRSPQARVKEIPFVFKNRVAGKSKLSPLVAFQFFEMLWDLRSYAGRRRP